jgi:DNA replication protein DnaC
MSNPDVLQPLTDIHNPFLARLAKRQNAFETPEQHAIRAPQKAEYQAQRARIQQEQLLMGASQRSVPKQRALMEIVLADSPAITDSLAHFQNALRWRASQTTTRGSEPVVRAVSGAPGTGKSCALARVVTRHPRTAVFVDARILSTTLRNGWSHNEAQWQTWLEVDLLGLDDLGAEYGDATVISTLLEQRYNAGLATLMTTNLQQAEFAKRYTDGRLVDRLINGQADCAWFATTKGSSLRNAATRAEFERAVRRPSFPGGV